MMSHEHRSDLDLALVGYIHVTELTRKQLADLERDGHHVEEYVPLVRARQ